jgi:hypothetical protein
MPDALAEFQRHGAQARSGDLSMIAELMAENGASTLMRHTSIVVWGSPKAKGSS